MNGVLLNLTYILAISTMMTTPIELVCWYQEISNGNIAHV